MGTVEMALLAILGVLKQSSVELLTKISKRILADLVQAWELILDFSSVNHGIPSRVKKIADGSLSVLLSEGRSYFMPLYRFISFHSSDKKFANFCIIYTSSITGHDCAKYF